MVMVVIKKLMKFPLRGFMDLGAIELCDDEDIEVCKEEVMSINDEVNIEDIEAKSLPSNKPTLELKPLPSSFKYDFLDVQKENLMIIYSQLNQE